MREIDRKNSIKRKKHVKTTTFVTLLVTATLILSGAVTGITMIMNEKTTMNANTGINAPLGAAGDENALGPMEAEFSAGEQGSAREFEMYGWTPIGGDLVYDNDMSFSNILTAQEDTNYNLDSRCADDFILDGTYVIDDVHWVGGYWNTGYDTAAFDWVIEFYNDDGTGNAPGTLYAGPFTFAWNQITKVVLEESPGWSIAYGCSVNIPETVFSAGKKYWIVIYGDGDIYPQSGWGGHTDPIKTHQMVFGSNYFGYPYWTDGQVIFGVPYDMAFQLTGFRPNHDVGVTQIKHPQTCDTPGCPCIPVEVEVANMGSSDETDIEVHVEIHQNLVCTSFPYDDYNIEWNFDGSGGNCTWQFVDQETWFPYVVVPNKGQWMAEFNQHGCTDGWASMTTHDPIYICGDCINPFLKFYMWHDDYGSDDYLDVWISTTGKYGVYDKIAGPFERLCCPDCPIGWVEHRVSLEEFICKPIWIKFVGHCDGTPSAYNLHIDDVCVFDLKYIDMKEIDLDEGEIKQVEFDCWEAECWWCQYANQDVEFQVGAWTVMEGDENPDNDGFGPCQNEFITIFIHVPYEHDVGDKAILEPADNYYMAGGEIPMKQLIKNYGKNPEGCFYVYMAVKDLITTIDLNEQFNNWEHNPEGYYTADDRPVGWRDYHDYASKYEYGWEPSYTSNAGGTSPEALLSWTAIYSNANHCLESPSIDTSGEVALWLEFKTALYVYSTYYYTYCYVEARSDPGDPWTDYTPWDNPIMYDYPAETYLLDISDEIGVDTQVRFRLISAYYVYWDYWYVDDVVLISEECGETILWQDKVCVDDIDVCEEQEIPFDPFIPEPPEECYCGTKKYCIESWTKMLDPPDENNKNDLKRKMITVEFLHDVGIVEFTSPAECATGGPVIFSQPYGDYCTGPFSDEAQGYRVYDNFWGLTQDIGDVHWWGLEAYGDDDPTGMNMEIAYFPDSGGAPDYGNPQATFYGTVGTEISFADTGIDWYGYSLYYFEMDHSCVSMSDGWLSVYRLDDGTGNRFPWMDDGAATGDGMAYQDYTMLTYDVSFELTACEDGDDEIPDPEVYIPCGDGDLSVLIENFGTYVEDPVVVTWKLFEYQPAKTEVASGTYTTDLDPGEQEDCLLGTYAFTPGVYELEVEVNLVPPSMDCNLANNGPEILIIGVDCCEPDCCFVLDPEDPNGENNWYVTDVTVTVDAWDTCEVQSGISHIVYIVDGVMNTIMGDHGVFVITGDGVHHGVVYAVDNAGHEGVHHTFEVAIDKTDPTVELVFSKFTDDAGTQMVQFTALAGDDTSGMNKVEFRIDGVLKETVPGPGPFVYTVAWAGYDENTEVCAKAFDDAGNDKQDCVDGIKFGKDRSQSQSRSYSLPVSRIILNLGR